MRIRYILMNNIGFKLLALLLAFITLIYVGETAKTVSEQTVLEKLFKRADYISKPLTVKPIFVGVVPDGYEFLDSDAKPFPESILVIGPAGLLDGKKFVYTKPIDLSEHTKTKPVEVELESVSRSVTPQGAKVQVYLAVKKIEETHKK